ncbi:kinetochore protein SPC24 homolog [Argentina anserina]|uniref:kinetochore protein SPC24 homolog n=1 Tax=Argentina anserina TaxID=57926 RepID=UPI0021763BE4|nr:kinetochore protein SPC24 homolog [Potentilla anserina]
MTGSSGAIDFHSLISYSDDLVRALKDQNDLNNLTHCIQTSHSLRSDTDSDLAEAQRLLRDYETKLEACKKKTEEVKSEAVADEELELLQRELDEGVQLEHLILEELRCIGSDMDDLEHQRVAVVDKNKVLKKKKQDELKAQRKLSMYASVTNIIPNLDDQSRIMGYIVDRDTKKVQNFEIDAEKMTAYETCDSMWKMITP